MSKQKKEFVKISQAAQELGFCKRTLERWIHSGKLKGFKLGKFTMIEREYFEEWKTKNFIEA